MKAVFEIIPHPNPWKRFWIFMAGCAVGAAGAIGGMFIKERAEVRDGCVIFRGKDKFDADSAQPEGNFNSTDSTSEATQGGSTGEAAAGQVPEDARDNLGG